MSIEARQQGITHNTKLTTAKLLLKAVLMALDFKRNY